MTLKNAAAAVNKALAVSIRVAFYLLGRNPSRMPGISAPNRHFISR
jgi:hypothetical protein